MNELFASEPAQSATESDVRRLFAYFGPFTGRYLAEYPYQWHPLTESARSSLGDVARARLSQLMRRAHEELKVLPQPALGWNKSKSWLENVSEKMRDSSCPIHSVICSSRQSEPQCYHLEFDELELPPTAEERVDATPSEFVRVSRTLLRREQELHFIDPYLDLNTREKRAVVYAMLSEASRGKCESVVIWARHRDVITQARRGTTESQLRELAERLMTETGLLPGGHLIYRLMDDTTSAYKMHARYLLTSHGGIRYDQGFQALGYGKRVDVAPIGKSTFFELEDIFLRGKGDMKCVSTIDISQSHRPFSRR